MVNTHHRRFLRMGREFWSKIWGIVISHLKLNFTVQNFKILGGQKSPFYVEVPLLQFFFYKILKVDLQNYNIFLCTLFESVFGIELPSIKADKNTSLRPFSIFKSLLQFASGETVISTICRGHFPPDTGKICTIEANDESNRRNSFFEPPFLHRQPTAPFSAFTSPYSRNTTCLSRICGEANGGEPFYNDATSQGCFGCKITLNRIDSTPKTEACKTNRRTKDSWNWLHVLKRKGKGTDKGYGAGNAKCKKLEGRED